MWYIKPDTLFIIIIFSVLYTVTGTIIKKKGISLCITPFLILFDLFILIYISQKLAIFYILYTLITYLLCYILEKCTKFKKFLFFGFCILCIIPLIYVRLTNFTDILPHFIYIIGFAFNMLKAIDALYFVYYTKQHIRILPYANFLLFFPVFTAGPLFRYKDFMIYYENPKFPDAKTVDICIKRFIMGLFKKLVIVQILLFYLNFLLPKTGSFIISFTIVIICHILLFTDLSGYSDMAISVGTFLGIPVPENFDRPIKSATFTQFWYRWHITLSNWFREHIFILLNGKKLNKYQSGLVAFSVVFLIGAWRGFTVLDIGRGAYGGLLIAFENIFSKTKYNRSKHSKLGYYLKCFIIMFLSSIGIATFYLNETQMINVLRGFLL